MDLGGFYNAYAKPLFDIAILSFIIYKGYEILLKTQAIQLVKGAAFMAVIYLLALFLNLSTLLWVLQFVAPGLFIGIAIVFQPELRKIFMRLGQGEIFRFRGKPKGTQVEAVLHAAETLSQARRGALIAFQRTMGLKHIADTGTKLNAELSSSLILSCFAYDTPLHDGAMLVHGSRIVAAGCFLPLSEQQGISRSFGTRHRAALGLSEESDAVVLIVSEETGAISLSYDSKLEYDMGAERAKRKLQELLELQVVEDAQDREDEDRDA